MRVFVCGLEFVDDFGELLAEADGVALADEYHAVEGVGNDENGERAVGVEFHLAHDVAFDFSVFIQSQSFLFFRIIFRKI